MSPRGGGCSDGPQPPSPLPQDPRLPSVFSNGISEPLFDRVTCKEMSSVKPDTLTY